MITVQNLTKRYGSLIAVDDITFTAPAGTVTGFLGPNGAGKSTTMRVAVGLTRATSGSVRVLGGDYTDLPNPAARVGVLLDASAQHAGRTGREVLTLLRQVNHELGITLVLVTHDLNVAEQAERIIQLEDGRIARDSEVMDR